MDATFTHALQVETAMLQAAHPILAEQLARAHALIVDGKVWPEADGAFMVQSSTDPGTWYTVNGHCECKASTYHPEPCKHRMGKRLYERVVERLVEEQERYDVSIPMQPVPQLIVEQVPAPLPEAPASVNCHIKLGGHQVQLTLRDTDETRLLARLEAVLQQYPVPAPTTQEPNEGWCSMHNVQMRLNPGKDGKPGWWSHKSHQGAWCKGKGTVVRHG